jgi:serine kinase of HPr protein (carbohydrate metabolism regulator)
MSEIVHGTAVLAGAHGVLIRGPSGSGKSTLAYALLARGGRLVADDRVHLSARDGRIIAAAVAPVAGLLELRGRGIMPVPHERSAVIRLIVDIVSETALERLPDRDQLTTTIQDVAIPRQSVPPTTERAITLVEAALATLSRPGESVLRMAHV